MDDIELVRRAMEGAEDAFDELLRRYEKPLLAYLCSKVKDVELALDLLQETFIDAFTGIKCLREPERFSSWLFTIARRKAWLARRKADEWEELPETIPIAPSAPDEVLRKELSELAGISKGRGKATELYFSPEHGFRAFPSRLRLGMKSSAFGRELRVERVVNVRVNGRSIKALEAVYPAAPAKGVLRLNRTYIAENGRLALFERYHSFEGELSGAAVNAPTRGSPRLFRQPSKPDVDQLRAGRGSGRLI